MYFLNKFLIIEIIQFQTNERMIEKKKNFFFISLFYFFKNIIINECNKF